MGERRGRAEEPGPDPTRHAVIWSTWYHPMRAQGLGFSSSPEPRGHEGRSKSDPRLPSPGETSARGIEVVDQRHMQRLCKIKVGLKETGFSSQFY